MGGGGADTVGAAATQAAGAAAQAAGAAGPAAVDGAGAVGHGAVAGTLAGASVASGLWTFPTLVFSAFVLGWAAEAAQFVFSQGLSLAILAWLQTLPEFAVEAVIAWNQNVPLMTANFTGSLRLLVGLGWPLIFITRALFGVKKTGMRATVIHLEKEHAVEVVSLFVPILYFVLIYLKASLNLIDAAILLAMYVAYLNVLSRIPPKESESVEDIPRVSRWALTRPGRWKIVAIFGLFLAGGVILYFVAHPFYQAMLGMAVALGVSQFVFVQWVAPFLSEFPEKVTAFNWARTGSKASLALMNMVSSNVNQWTVLAAMIPIVYSISRGEPSSIPFDAYHRTEILLTVIQSFLGMLLLANLEFRWYEAIGLFVLWAVQFAFPHLREEIIVVYAGWCVFELLLAVAGKKQLRAFPVFIELWRTHQKPRRARRR
jgi:cation:H+ antiporter